MSNQYLEVRVSELEAKVSNLQKDNEGLTQTLLDISTSVEHLNRRVNMLEDTLATKADISHIK